MDEIRIADHSGLEITTRQYFHPNNLSELIDFINKNTSRKFRVGGGLTGVSGAAIPLIDEWFIDMNGLNRLSWIDERAGILEADSGVTMGMINDFLKSSGWFFPSMPGMLKATVGGMIANNGGGPFSLKYGKIDKSVMSIHALFANGEICELGGLATKISQGINLRSLFIGTEGTLGIITKAVFRCQPKLKKTHYYRFSFKDFFKLLEAVPEFLKYDPFLLEAAEKDALKFSSLKDEYVIWVCTQVELPEEFLKRYNFSKENESIMDERFQIGHNLQTYKPFIDLDVSFGVPLASKALLELKKLLNDYAFENVFFGHAGDANWHIHVFFNEDQQKWRKCESEFDAVVKKYGGFISGEHGIGRLHKHRLLKNHSKINGQVYKAVKEVFDPKGQFPYLY